MQMRHSEIPMVSNEYARLKKRRPFLECLACPLCKNLLKDPTTISVCCHTSCKHCIYRKLDVDATNYCPVCNTYLSSLPLQVLRIKYALPQIRKPYIRTRSEDLAVSYVNKYLAYKLNLKHESEVEIMCCGQPLLPDMTLRKLADVWTQAMSVTGPFCIKSCDGNADGHNFMMELTYRRSNKL